MLLSPGTAISMSIRGARFTRSSINKETLVNACCRLLNQEKGAALIQHPISASAWKTLKAIRYGTRKILSVYGSFTSVPGGNPSTSMYLPGE
jgi:hypothetical protein